MKGSLMASFAHFRALDRQHKLFISGVMLIVIAAIVADSINTAAKV